MNVTDEKLDKKPRKPRHYKDLDNLPRFVTRVFKALEKSLAENRIESTLEQNLNITAKICGYKSWGRLKRYVAYGDAAIITPGVTAGSKIIRREFKIKPKVAKNIAAQMREKYERNRPNQAGLISAIEQDPALLDVGIGSLNLSDREVRRLKASGRETLGDLMRDWDQLDKDRAARILNDMILTATA